MPASDKHGDAATMTADMTAVMNPECRAKKPLSSPAPASDDGSSPAPVVPAGAAGSVGAGGTTGSAGVAPVGNVPFGSVLIAAGLASQGFGRRHRPRRFTATGG